jgi:hypothetical protein
MSRFNILRKANIRNSTACRFDTNEGYSVVWEEDSDFKQYGEFNGITTRTVVNQNYFSVATSGVCYVGPTTDQPGFDAGLYDTVVVTYRVDVGFNQATPTTARIQFQTEDDPSYDTVKVLDFSINADNAYNKYTVDMSQFKEWEGNITRIRLYPFIDGAPGNKIHLKSISVQSSSTHACASRYDGGGVCSKFSEYSHPCPWTGSGGSIQSQLVDDGIEVVEGVSDELSVNINGYGEQVVTLKPTRSGLLKDIARDIEDKISNVGIAGYADNRVDAALNTIKIIADGTRETISTVVVSDTPAARLLGFYDEDGNNVSVSLPGEDAATRYAPAGTVQLSKGEIAHFYVPDQNTNEGAVVIDPRSYAAEAGRPDFASVTQEQYVDFPGKTVIDFNHPVSQTATFSFFGYSGDATNDTEILFFRPNSLGELTLYDTESLGATGSLLGKVFDKTFSKRLRKGDLIGLYDGRIYTGGDAEHPNVSYFLHDGQLSVGDTIKLPVLYGKGDEGLFLYARSKDKQTAVVLDVEFDQPELIEEIEVIAIEEVREEVINLTQTLSGGINGGPFITGETGLDKFGSQAPALTDLGALTDGVKVNSPTATSMHPSWLDGPFDPPDLYAKTEFYVTLDFAKGVPVLFDISRVIMYFRDIDNIKFFRLDYPITTNPSDTDRNWGSVTDTFDAIRIDGKLLQPSDHALYSHPMQVTSSTFTHNHQFLEYNFLEFEFGSVPARSLRYGVRNDYFSDDVTSFDYSDYPLATSPYVLEMEVFATSTPKASIADNFFFESSTEGDSFVQHSVVRDTGETSARYLIGYPVRHLKVHIVPQGKVEVKSFGISLSQSAIAIDTNVGSSTIAMQISQQDFLSAEVATIKNESAEAYNYYIDIAPQRNPVERCLLWNKMGTEDELNKSQIGPSPAVSKRDGFLPRETNFALNVPGYVLDPFWMVNANCVSYQSYDHGATWEDRGNTATNYNFNDELNSKTPLPHEYTYVYILVDLGDIYDPKTVERRHPGGTSAKTSFGATFYSKDLNNSDNPEDLDLINDFSAILQPCRWLRWRALAHDPDSFSQVPTLSFVRVVPDAVSSYSFNNLLWIQESRLTDYTFGSSSTPNDNCANGWNCALESNQASSAPNYYAIDLEYHYDPYNILLGPQSSDALSLTTDVDALLPGGPGSAYTSGSRLNSDIAYGFTQTDDPSKVYWGAFGAEPPEYTRWILIKVEDGIHDEVAVHVNDNDPEKKPLFGNARWWTALLGTVTKDYSTSPTGTHSMSVDYVANQGPAIEEIEVLQSFGIDEVLAKRDQLRLMFYVSDVSQMDLTQGHIAVGRNETEANGGNSPNLNRPPDRANYFQWNISDMAGLITTGWNILHLPFTDNFRVGQPFFTRDDYLSLGPTSVSGKSRLRWFRINFAGKENNDEFSVKVAEWEMVRGDFLPAKFGNGYYLAGQDYAKFPLNNFNTLQGTVEFYISADWSKVPGCNTCDDPKDHTILRLFNSEDFMIGLFMTGDGMRLHATNGDEVFNLSDNNSPYLIRSDVNTHLAVTWDFLGERSDRGLAFYVDGKLSSSIDATNMEGVVWAPNPNVMLMLGGLGWDGIISPLASSVDGVIDNLKVYNYAKSDFSHSVDNEGLEQIRASDELVEISTDGVNFYGSSARGTDLPLLARNVPPGAEFKVYVRNREQEGDTSTQGQERICYLEVIRARAG